VVVGIAHLHGDEVVDTEGDDLGCDVADSEVGDELRVLQWQTLGDWLLAVGSHEARVACGNARFVEAFSSAYEVRDYLPCMAPSEIMRLEIAGLFILARCR
jgi:hypothetical protein